MHQIIETSTTINNIIQDQMVIFNKILTSQIEITDIISKFIIKIIDSSKMLWNVSALERKAMLGMIILYGRKLLKKKKRIPNQKLE
jgi:hypothetical protein